MILSSTPIEKCKDIAVQDQPQETFVLNLARSTVHCLGDIETMIWSRIDGTSTAGEIAMAVCEEYEVDPERAREDVLEFLNDLCSKGLIRERSAA